MKRATTTNVDSTTGVATNKEAEEEAEVEEQRVAAVVAHAQSSGVVPAVEAPGKCLFTILLRCARLTILSLADVSGGAGCVVGEGARGGVVEGARGRNRGEVHARGGGRGRGRGRGAAPLSNRTRAREVRPAEMLFK